jgi:hypothetical protein
LGLDKQIIPISFGQGIDTKSDKKQQIIGKLRRAKNVVFETLLSARKRNGYDSILLYDTNGDRINNAMALSKYKNELVVFDTTSLYSFSDSLQKLQLKGAIYEVFPFATPVLNNSYNHDSLDTVSAENLNVHVYHNTITDDVRYSVQDIASKSLIISDDVVATGAQTVQVAAIQNYIYIVYAQGANLRYRRFNILSPGAIEAPVNLASDVEVAAPKVDIISGPDKIIIAYNSTQVGSELHVLSVLSSGTPTSTVGVSGANPSVALDVYMDASFRIIISYSDGTEVGYTIFPYNLVAAILLPTTLETIANVKTVSAIETTTGSYIFYYEISAASAVNHLVKSVTAVLAGTVGTPAVFQRSMGLASKVFAHEGIRYIPLAFETTLQSTYFVVDQNNTTIAKWSQGQGGGHILTGVLPQTIQLSDDEYLITSQMKSKLVSENGTFFGLLGVNSVTLNFAYESPYQNAFLADNLHISGGILQLYDGDTVTEHGFHMSPETLVAGATAGVGGFMSNGNYSYRALYRWTDNAGQEHVSTPSLELTVVLSGGTATQIQAVAVPTLRLTNKSNVVLELYRTENNGSIYYLVSSASAPTFNNKAVDTVTITDTLSDASLISRQTLYTTGGVLENTSAPATTVMTVHTASNRLVVANADSGTIQYSKIQSKGKPVEFNDDLVKTLDTTAGKITALGNIDDKIIIFHETSIQYFSGAGPTNTGEQDLFTDPEDISGDVGCIDPRSLGATTMGIFFKSKKGLYLLGRDLSVRYIGAPVEQYNSLTISSTKVIADFNQIRFTTTDGDTLVYNYHLDLWCTFDNHRALSAEVVNNQYYYLRTSHQLFKENPTVFGDNGIPIKLLLETGWMSLVALQGYQRVYQMLVLGDYKSEHKLKISASYNFNEALVQEKLITPSAEFIDGVPYGEHGPYGLPEDIPYGGSGNVYQARFDFKQQKCQAIKLQIEDVQSAAGEGLSLSAMTLLVGGKGGLFKVDTGRKFGLE